MTAETYRGRGHLLLSDATCVNIEGRIITTCFFIVPWLDYWHYCVMPSSVMELLECWRFGRGRQKEVWQAVPLCLLWCIWREHNTHCFEGKLEVRGGGDLNLDVNI